VVSAREAQFSRSADSSDPEQFICISVIDSGTGMDHATLQRAMEPFFTTKGLGKGTGLGLSMVHGLAEQSGGKLVLTSVEGSGTTAELWLPISSVAAEPPRLLSRPEELSDATAIGRPLKVLFVDDDPLVLLSTRAMIEDLGHHVMTACGGIDALALVRQYHDFDLVITDYVMPNMTGSELAWHISVLYPALPIIISSGFTDTPSIAASGLPRLPKPFNQAELARAIALIRCIP
jgi:CheY-like chemotaxis protein